MASVPVLKGGTVQAPLYLIERKTVHKTDDDAAMGNPDGFAQYVFRVVHVFQHGEQSCVIEFFIVEREMFRAAQLEFSPVPQPFPRHVEQVSTGIKPRDIKSIVPEHLQKDTRSTPYVQKRMPAPGPLRDQVLKKADKDEIATLTTLAGLVIVLMMVIDMISQLFDTLKSLFAFY